MAGETTNPVQLGGPRKMRMVHPIENTQMYLVSFSQPVAGHFWLIHRIACTMQANAASASQPPLFNIYEAAPGVHEISGGLLEGTNMVDTNGPQGSDLVLLDCTPFSINGTTNITPFIVADEVNPIYVPENRVLVCYINGYDTADAKGFVQVEIQYTDWLRDVPKVSPIPHEPKTVEEA